MDQSSEALFFIHKSKLQPEISKKRRQVEQEGSDILHEQAHESNENSWVCLDTSVAKRQTALRNPCILQIQCLFTSASRRQIKCCESHFRFPGKDDFWVGSYNLQALMILDWFQYIDMWYVGLAISLQEVHRHCPPPALHQWSWTKGQHPKLSSLVFCFLQ